MRHVATAIGLVILLGLGARDTRGADTKLHACSLLTAAEVTAAVGGAAGQPQESEFVVPDGPSKGDAMGMCTWPTDGGQSSVSVAITRAASGPSREAALAKMAQVFDVLKAQGWSEERKDFANGRCVLMTPPAARGLPVSTGCFAEAKGMGLSVGHNGPTRASMDRVRTLLDKAIGRLP